MNIFLDKQNNNGITGNSILKTAREAEKPTTGKEQTPQKKVFMWTAPNEEKNIGENQARMQRSALRLVMDQFQSDMSVDAEFGSSLDNQKKLVNETAQAQQEVNRIDQLQEELRTNYGVSVDSKEEKDLSLIRKIKDSSQCLTKDELKQVASLDGLTDYQQEALKFDKIKDVWKDIIDDGNREIGNISATISAMSIELVKSHPMIDAQDTATQMVDAASKEQMAQLMNQVKEQIDEHMDQVKEEKESTESKKDKDSGNQSQLDQLQNSGSEVEHNKIEQLAVQQKVEALIKKLGILDEDVKGIKINEKI